MTRDPCKVPGLAAILTLRLFTASQKRQSKSVGCRANRAWLAGSTEHNAGWMQIGDEGGSWLRYLALTGISRGNKDLQLCPVIARV